MKEITITVPDGYMIKVAICVVLLCGALAAAPYYVNYLDRVRAQTRIVEAQAEAEAKKIALDGQCEITGKVEP